MAEKSSVWDCVVYHKLLAAVQLIWWAFFHLDFESLSRRWGEKRGTQLTPIPWPRVGTCTLHFPFPPSTVLQKINKQLSLTQKYTYIAGNFIDMSLLCVCSVVKQELQVPHLLPRAYLANSGYPTLFLQVIFFWPYNKTFIDQALLVKMAKC